MYKKIMHITPALKHAGFALPLALICILKHTICTII